MRQVSHSTALALCLITCWWFSQAVSATASRDYVTSGLEYNKNDPSSEANHALLTTAASSGTRNNANVDKCWTSWEQWWSASNLEKSGTVQPVSTYTTFYTSIYETYSGTTDFETHTLSTVQTFYDGGFPIDTATIDRTSTYTYVYLPRSASTEIDTNTLTGSSTFYPDNTLLRPTCYLPKSVNQCQQQWESWITTQLVPMPTPPHHCDIGAGLLNSRTLPPCAKRYSNDARSWAALVSQAAAPVCTQASIGGDLCTSVRDYYIQSAPYNFRPDGATTMPFVSAGYLGAYDDPVAGNFSTSFYWPTSATLGVPGCTLGCGRCAVTGGSVRLLYWPPATTAVDTSVLSTVPVSAPVTAVTLGTTFTSPTLYVSYSNVYAADGCGDVGTPISDTIVPIPDSMPLSSVHGGTIPCDAHPRYGQVWIATAPFTIGDLYERPVPYSIYSSQPWCATYLRSRVCSGTCPTTRPYEPILVVPEQILQEMQPEWSTCYGDITGVYDPPIALQPASTVPGPQTPGGAYTIETKTATPASGPGLSVPSPTSPPTTESNAVVEVDSSQQTAEAVTNPYAEAGDDVHGSSADQTHGNDQEEPTAQDASKNAEADSGLSAETGDNVQGSSADQNYSTGGDDDIAQDPSQMSDANSGSSAEGNDDSAAGPVDPSENTTFSQDIAGTSSVLDGAATSTKKSAAPSVIADGGDGQTAGSDAVSADGEDYETSESNITSVVNADISSAKPATANNGQMTKVISADSSHTINSAEAANSGPSGYDAAGKQSITAESQQATDTAMLTHSFGPSAVVNTFAFGSKTLIVSPTDDRQEIVRLASATLTVSPRGPASTIDGLTVRAAVNGRLLVASEALTSTFTPASDPNAIRTTVTYSSQTLTINEQPNGVDVLENQSTTISLTPDGTAVMLGGLMVSEASNGALAYETSEPTTAAVMSGLSSPATSGHEGGVSATSALLSNTGPVSTFSLAAVAVVAALLSVMLIV